MLSQVSASQQQLQLSQKLCAVRKVAARASGVEAELADGELLWYLLVDHSTIRCNTLLISCCNSPLSDIETEREQQAAH